MLFFYKKQLDKPEWIVLKHHTALEIKDNWGKEATLTKEIKIRSNHKGISEFYHRDIRADGEIDNFRFGDGRVVPESNIEKKANAYVVRENLGEPLPRNTEKNCTLIFDLHGSFLGKQKEDVGYSAQYDTAYTSFDLSLPAGRPAVESSVHLRTGANRKELERPKISHGWSKITWDYNKTIKAGTQLVLEWKWQSPPADNSQT